ncbi:nuclear transport factor 2 family protein [Ferrimonas aestuarii]|uniref:Nuclear transport factor 2 family protein n=2 Tax=Ferrimonas aestuarii TaxID=2569539 RepID=A0A4U1BP25_9GAMM|nr:nuclear transport factor 2 family protein [Ferrimonas aestuarii]
MKGMKHYLLVIALFLSGSAWANESEVRQVLMQQQQAWNQGDIPGYMQGYWQSEQLRFISSGKIKYGWQKVLDGYLSRYPDRDTMGKLDFELESITMLSDELALVVGRWQLTRKHDQPKGEFSLVFRKIDGYWRIINDHTG